jgi:hypothetical protein
MLYTIDMPPSIVWIALAEPEMMSGWWGETRLEPWPGGAFRIELRGGGSVDVTGTVERIRGPAELVLRTVELGRVRFALESLPGGTRGTSTTLTVEIDRYPLAPVARPSPHLATRAASSAAVHTRWDAHITDLTNLLHGHPVDWTGSGRQRSTRP